MDKIYKYSGKYLNQQKKLTIYLFSVVWLFFAIVMLFTVGTNSITFLIIIPNGIIFALVTYFFLKFYFSSMKNFEIHLTAYGIERKNGNKIETLLYKDIKKMTIKSTKSGESKSIKINLPKKSLLLLGFEDINGLIAELKNKVSPDVIKQKTMILDWNNPIVTVSFMLFVLIVVYLGVPFVEQFTGLNASKITGIIFLLAGIQYLYVRPSSRIGVYNGEKYDVVLGIVFILLGLFNIFK